jgi:hypothetical protein
LEAFQSTQQLLKKPGSVLPLLPLLPLLLLPLPILP